ncbi:MAG TPA: HAD family phosphatase [Ignavibacteriaceae bacterium]|nr:HAD family phosphatase [Ignavibacteriaceae bacterium]
MIKAILFDLDGVIVDSLYFHYLAWEKMFNDLGGSVKLNTVLEHEGRNSFEILPILMEESGIHISEKDRERLINEKREYYRSIAELTYYDKAFETIAGLKSRGYKIALVTACARKNMEKSVSLENQKLFDVIVSGEDVCKAKPNPDPYLTAQKALGMPIDECVVIENAPLGIESAKAAGMICIAIESTLGKEYLQKADFLINTISEVSGFFPELKR